MREVFDERPNRKTAVSMNIRVTTFPFFRFPLHNCPLSVRIQTLIMSLQIAYINIHLALEDPETYL